MLAEGFGARGARVTASDELRPKLQWALEQELPVILEVPVDARENLKLTEHLGDLVCPI